jgi:hypothetical protein
VETILTIAAMPIAAAAVVAAAYEAVLLAGRDTTMGRWVRHLMVGPQPGGTVLPVGLKLMAVMLVYAVVAIALAPLVIAVEVLVLARRRHRGEVIGPAPWPRASSQAQGRL